MDLKTRFINLLKNSGLPADRKNYWIVKFEVGDLSQQDQQAFVNELEKHLSTLDLKIFDKKNEKKEKEAKLTVVYQQLIPELEVMAEQSEEIFDRVNKECEKEMIGIENRAIQDIEKVRREDEEAQIAALKNSFK